MLGFTALKAGLTMAPASLISMFVAPVAGRMVDRIGGKYILMAGLTLFGVGMGWLALVAHPDLGLEDLPGAAGRGRDRDGLHVRPDDHGGHAQRRPGWRAPPPAC